MGWPKKLVLVRHGESEGNVLSREERARWDVPTHQYKLTERGRRQAEITGQYLRDCFKQFDRYYVSTYARSRETMEIMFPGAKLYEDARLDEANRGIWHTMTDEQIRTRFPEEFARKDREDLYHHRPLGGENWPDMELRGHSFLGTLARDYDDENVLVVGHGHWLVILQRLIHHFSIEEAMRRYKENIFENTSVTVYESLESRGCLRLVLMQENVIPWKDKL